MFKLFLTIVLNLPLDFAPFSCHFLEPTPPGTEQIFQLHFRIFGMTSVAWYAGWSWLQDLWIGESMWIYEWVAGFKMYI